MIPEELRELNQWCCSSKESKIPLNARTRRAASSNDPSTWSSYDEAVNAGFPFVGFMLSEHDPYTIIDLDAPENEEQRLRHSQILETLDSYAELSKSGQGVHIIVRGSIPKGVKRDNVEIYSSLRYMICTGNVIADKPIAERQELLDILFQEMDTTEVVELTEVDELFSDAEVVEMAMSASNADKFNMLCRGEWQQDYTSQSRADFALLSMFAYYTRSNKQVKRLFHMSALGKRSKAFRPDYIPRSLAKIRAKLPEEVVDFSKLLIAPPAPVIEVTEPECLPEIPKDISCSITYPSGLIGEIAHYIYSSSFLPIHELGIAAAFSTIAGLAGRAFNVSTQGLNLYLIVLAKTGIGKSGMKKGIQRLFKAVETNNPVMTSHRLFTGPGEIASGQALIKVLAERPCFLSVLGEIGLTLQQLCSPRANGAEKKLMKVLMEVYTESGINDSFDGMAYSDTTKNVAMIHAPCVSILGETTPETFFDGLNVEHVLTGLIPRFSIIEYCGDRPKDNPNAFMPPSPILAQKVEQIILVGLKNMENGIAMPINFNGDAKRLKDEYSNMIRSKVNEASAELERKLWTRAAMQAMKMAGLIAIGHNLYAPVISGADMQWGIDFINASITAIERRFNEGAVGNGDHRREHELMLAAKAYSKISAESKAKTYRVPESLLDKPGLIPWCYFRDRLRGRSVFKEHRLGATKAIKDTLDNAVEAEILDEYQGAILSTQLRLKNPLRSKVYGLGKRFSWQRVKSLM